MIGSARLLISIGLIALLAACSGGSQSLSKAPILPQGGIPELLAQAATSNDATAAVLRLSAAEQAAKQGDMARVSSILPLIDVSILKPNEQALAQTLAAEAALSRKQPKQALSALSHPVFARLAELPMEQQVRIQLARAQAQELSGDTVSAIRERIYLAPMLNQAHYKENQETIWRLLNTPGLSIQAAPNEADLAGWISLRDQVITARGLKQQKDAIEQWRLAHLNHPAALQLPDALSKLQATEEIASEHITLLLPMQGQLAGVASALRDGFLGAHFQAQQSGEDTPQVNLVDSSTVTDIDSFYREAQAAGVQLVIGPLDKNLVRQLAARQSLPIPTLALNYSDIDQSNPPELFQFGLAAEDEAHAAAERAWNEGHRQAIALVPTGEWGQRVLHAFEQRWHELGGTLVGSARLGSPAELSRQVGQLLQVSGESRRQDIDMLFLAASPEQAQQVKPTLDYYYAADLPVFATSHLYSANGNQLQYNDLNGIVFTETPWLLDDTLPMRQQIERQWPQAASSLGRLYAMGADAYLLSTHLGQLQAMSSSTLPGVTGKLSMNANQRIERVPSWAMFQNGKVVVLPAQP